MARATMAGHLLVATPLIGDPTFERTVILLLAHGAEGSLGVVLNRPTETAASELVPGWGDRASAPCVLFIGGPVGTDAVIGLDTSGTIDLNSAPTDEDDSPIGVRLFAGSAGWGAGQLDAEIGEQAWWVVESEPGDAFTNEPSELWRTVLRRQPAPIAWFATFPPDLMAN